MTDKVWIFKTMQGIDYMGKWENEGSGDTFYEVNDMFAIMPQQSQQDGEVHVAFGAPAHPALADVPHNSHGRIDVELERSVVVFKYRPNEQLLDMYLEATSGIQIAKQMPGNL